MQERCGNSTVRVERKWARAHGGQKSQSLKWNISTVSSWWLSFNFVERNTLTFIVFLQHTPIIHIYFKQQKAFFFCKNKTVTAATIHRLSSGHMFMWSHDLVEIKSTNQRSVWDSSLCKRWDKKNCIHVIWEWQQECPDIQIQGICILMGWMDISIVHASFHIQHTVNAL